MRWPGNSAQSPRLDKALHRAGQWRHGARGENVALDPGDHAGGRRFLQKRTDIDFVVVGPEAPLVAGLGDDLRAAGITVFGPSTAAGAARRLEELSPRRCATRWTSRPPRYAPVRRRGRGARLCPRAGRADRHQGGRAGRRQGRDRRRDPRRGGRGGHATASTARSATPGAKW